MIQPGIVVSQRASSMSAISIPVSRPSGRVIVVANPSLHHQPDAVMQQLGFECQSASDPYAAFAEVCANPSSFHAVVLSLQSLYREELSLIATIKRRFAHLEIWLMHTDGRQAALAEAMRLGADGLLAEDGLHRIAMTPPAPVTPVVESIPAAATAENAPADENSGASDRDFVIGEPVLTADELRALLHEQPSYPPNTNE
jgi:hypothetical protein